MYEILLNGKWVEGKPVSGEAYRFYISSKSGAHIESVWTGEEVRPEVKESISRREFWQRVGDAKYAELLTIAESDNLLKARLDIINADQNVWLLSPEYTDWFAGLVSSEVITQDDYDLIFNLGVI